MGSVPVKMVSSIGPGPWAASLRRCLAVSTTFIALAGCANIYGAPFPADLKLPDSESFVFLARGTWASPANTVSGEKIRMDWLADYLATHDICDGGYAITSRRTEINVSAKQNVQDQAHAEITYTGRCTR